MSKHKLKSYFDINLSQLIMTTLVISVMCIGFIGIIVIHKKFVIYRYVTEETVNQQKTESPETQKDNENLSLFSVRFTVSENGELKASLINENEAKKAKFFGFQQADMSSWSKSLQAYVEKEVRDNSEKYRAIIEKTSN